MEKELAIPITSLNVMKKESVIPITSLNILRDEVVQPIRTNLLDIKTNNHDPKNIKFAPIRKYNLKIFLERAELLYGNKYDYSLVTEEHAKSYYSYVPVICNKCRYYWTPPIVSHINQRHECSTMDFREILTTRSSNSR